MEDWLTAYRRRALILTLIAAFLGGFSSDVHGFSQVLAALTFGSAVTLWCTLDARIHSKEFLHSFGWQMMWIWPIGAVVLLVLTRGRRGVLTYLLLGAACVASGFGGLGIASVLSQAPDPLDAAP